MSLLDGIGLFYFGLLLGLGLAALLSRTPDIEDLEQALEERRLQREEDREAQ